MRGFIFIDEVDKTMKNNKNKNMVPIIENIKKVKVFRGIFKNAKSMQVDLAGSFFLIYWN